MTDDGNSSTTSASSWFLLPRFITAHFLVNASRVAACGRQRDGLQGISRDIPLPRVAVGAYAFKQTIYKSVMFGNFIIWTAVIKSGRSCLPGRAYYYTSPPALVWGWMNSLGVPGFRWLPEVDRRIPKVPRRGHCIKAPHGASVRLLAK